jgi:hypothetical protein
MKRTIFLLLLVTTIFTACNKEEEITLSDTGTVINYAGAGDCGFVIELDNGGRIQPLFFPEGFVFSEGQRVLVEYSEMHNIISSCDRGIASEISYLEELSCTPYIDLYFDNYDSLARDPIYLNDAFVDGNCLQVEISYSGGCKDHTIDLALMHPWIDGSTSIPTFEIRHNANDDMCEAFFTREMRFDLTPLILEGTKEIVLTAKLVNGEIYNQVFTLTAE